MRDYTVDDLTPGTVFECRLYTGDGRRLADPFTPLDEERLELLRQWGIRTVRAEEAPLDDDVLEQYRQRAEAQQEPPQPDGSGIEHDATEEARSLSLGLKNQVRSSFEEAYERTEELLEPLSKGMVSDSRTIYGAIQPMMEGVWHLPRVVMFLMSERSLSDDREYINLYSLKTSIYSLLLSSALGYDRDEAQTVGAAGLVHDVGMLKIPQHIRMKEGQFDAGERSVMESHPERGTDLLEAVDSLESSVTKAVVQHHEQHDGNGYPEGLSGEEIHPHARIVHLAMTFTAMTQPRLHRSGRQSVESVQSLLEDDRDQFHPDVFNAFLEMIGILPLGTFVELASGYHAMVVGTNPDSPRHPKVKVVVDPAGHSLAEPYLVDLEEDSDSIERILQKDIMGYSAMEFA